MARKQHEERVHVLRSNILDCTARKRIHDPPSRHSPLHRHGSSVGRPSLKTAHAFRAVWQAKLSKALMTQPMDMLALRSAVLDWSLMEWNDLGCR